MHDINLIYSQYIVDTVLEERRDQANDWRRAETMRTRVPLVSRVMALLRWQRTNVEAVREERYVTPTAEGARS
jgi:hypothetical protein